MFAALPANAEAIAVDDGSIDGTLAVLQSLASSDSRLKVI
ncbi:MAG: glycosyltransferase, partial [Clostridia bacterium]|nr:glycosyltransferase [Clostridia bacterium]